MGGDWSGADAINDKGQIVGYADPPGDNVPVAFLYSGGTMQGLYSGTEEALAINNSGQVVGYCTNFDAFLYSSGSVIDLSNLMASAGWLELTEATGINDNGQIMWVWNQRCRSNSRLSSHAHP